jgi:hypothetical protein
MFQGETVFCGTLSVAMFQGETVFCGTSLLFAREVLHQKVLILTVQGRPNSYFS